ncbi:unnamed protein product [Effrenium voratum]|nr:unnamed protein product [Effrenium voratum]
MAPWVAHAIHSPTGFEAFMPHEFVAGTAQKVKLMPDLVPEHEKAAGPKRKEQDLPEELPRVRTLDDEDSERFGAKQRDPQLLRLGARMDEKLDKLEDRFLTGDLQNLVVPVPGDRPPIAAANAVHILQGKPSSVDPSLGSTSRDIDDLLQRVDQAQTQVLRGPRRSDRLEGFPSSALASQVRRQAIGSFLA